MITLLFFARRFRARRLLLPHHAHVNGLCTQIPAEWETLRNQTSTYLLWRLV